MKNSEYLKNLKPKSSNQNTRIASIKKQIS